MSVDLARYREFLAKVDSKFSGIQTRQSARMACAGGCHACCVPGLAVFRIERENLAAHVRGTPGLAEKLAALEAADPHAGARCAFLDETGRCAVYPARPLVCRSHGAPLFSSAPSPGEPPLLDACPLNFTDLGTLAEVPASDFINLDTANAILVALNLEIDVTGERFALNAATILGR